MCGREKTPQASLCLPSLQERVPLGFSMQDQPSTCTDAGKLPVGPESSGLGETIEDDLDYSEYPPGSVERRLADEEAWAEEEMMRLLLGQRPPIPSCVRRPPSSANGGVAPDPWPVLDLWSEEDTDMPVPGLVYSIKVRMRGNMPRNTTGLIIPRSEVTFSGTHISPAAVTDPKTDVMYLAAWNSKPTCMKKGYLVAHLLFISAHPVDPPSPLPDPPAEAAAFPVINISTQRPSMTLDMGGHRITGLIDTGADISVIAKKSWPSAWPTTKTPSVVGVGGLTPAERSVHPILFQSSSGLTIPLHPHILDIPVTLWGRDLLSQGQTVLKTNF